jgi:ABC-type multidrug transport system fused ATPase/permease subunit
VLFTGSIRENLAPFGGHSDSALWSALRRAHLAPVVEDWQAEGLGGLDFVLGEGGSPLSAGQKQLLALARALLNPAKVTQQRGPTTAAKPLGKPLE